MSLTKIEFADKTVEVFKIKKRLKKLSRRDSLRPLNYNNCANAIAKFVSAENQKTFEEIKSQGFLATDESSILPRNVQAKTKFINRAGVFARHERGARRDNRIILL
ncbi:BRO [Orgyia pseudotsugata single capsid nuclopolyhedrovirus]|nr:BRO [Orgyia pseudotsugata single capsid nuclopolyhedrovirus]